jgi:hypothetical protein
MTGRTLEKKILKEIFSQVSKKEKTRKRLTFGFEMLFDSSDVFSVIVKSAIKAAVDECWKDVKRFKRDSFVRTILASHEQEKRIIQSLSKIDNFSKYIHGIELSEGYSVNRVWNEIFAYTRRVSQIL